MSKGSDAPPAPDYNGLAQQQGAANTAAARTTAKLSNPNIINPYGSQTVTWGDNDQATVEQKLNPTQQALFDSQQQMNSQLSSAATTAAGNVQKTTATPFSFTGAQGLVDKAQEALMSRLNPQLDRQRQMRESALISGGHARGSEGYGAEIGTLDRSQNDARMQAIISALGYSPQLLQQEIAIRNQPLNELNALRGQSQATVPTFQNYTGASAAPAPIFAAGQAQDQANMSRYNASVAGDNAMMGGLFSLGSAFMGAPSGGAMSKVFGFN